MVLMTRTLDDAIAAVKDPGGARNPSASCRISPEHVFVPNQHHLIQHKTTPHALPFFPNLSTRLPHGIKHD
jgi:hypothetical protein